MPRKEIRAKKLGVSVDQLPDGRGRHGGHRKGSSHHKWQESLLSDDGYKLVRVGTGHPLACPNGYAREHILIVASAFGLDAVKGKVVHHKNGDKLDNRIENLQIMTMAEHNKIHNYEKVRNVETGRFIGKKAAGRLLDGKEWNEVPE